MTDKPERPVLLTMTADLLSAAKEWPVPRSDAGEAFTGDLLIHRLAEEVEAQAALLAQRTAERDSARNMLDVSVKQTSSRNLEIQQALELLKPNCVDETLCGAIRNLQQAYISERDNAEVAEADLARLMAVIDGHRAWLSQQWDTEDLQDALADLDQRLAPQESP